MVDVGNHKGIRVDGGDWGGVCLLGVGGGVTVIIVIVEIMKKKMLITKKTSNLFLWNDSQGRNRHCLRLKLMWKVP